MVASIIILGSISSKFIYPAISTLLLLIAKLFDSLLYNKYKIKEYNNLFDIMMMLMGEFYFFLHIK